MIDVYYFGAPLKQELGKEIYSQQQKMFSRFRKLGWKVVLCKRRKREKEGIETHKIKEDDIKLVLQMQKDASIFKEILVSLSLQNFKLI